MRPHPDGYPIKLVRDWTATIINPSGEPGDLFYAPLSGDVTPWLKKKLGEEVLEYLVEPGVEELRDVLVAVEALGRLHGVTLGELMAMASADDRGGFEKSIIMFGRHPEYDR